MTQSVLHLRSPIGIIVIRGTDRAVTEISVVENMGKDTSPTECLRTCATQLQEYFEGKRDTFTVPTSPEGTAFQRTVWNALKKIPAGKKLTYGDLAKKIGLPGAARAVGQALNKNPLLIVVPCHRVVASNGLGGFACGLKAKQLMLSHEQQKEKNVYATT